MTKRKAGEREGKSFALVVFDTIYEVCPRLKERSQIKKKEKLLGGNSSDDIL